MASKRGRDDRVAEPHTAGATDVAVASICPQTPVPQSTAECFPAGAEVEVRMNSKGFYGSWFEAKVLLSRSSSSGHVKYKIQYRTLLRDEESQELLVEYASEKNVRPPAPCRLNATGAGCTEDEDPNLKMHDLVEAYHNDGWWHGVLSGLRDPNTGLYTVSFPSSREVFQFKPDEIRPKLAYINRKWVPVLGEETSGTFNEGDNVEVSFRRDDYGRSYFLAQVEKVIHSSYFLVKYENPHATPNGSLTEIVDPSDLRPAYDGSKTGQFMADSCVEVFLEGGWSPGVVLSCLSGSNYAVTYKYKGEPTTELFNVSELRWRLHKRGRPSKGMKRKSANSDKTRTSDISLTERSEITPDCMTSSSKKLKMERSEEIDEIQSPLQHKVSTSIDLEPGEEVPITEFNKVRPEPNRSNSSFSSINMRAFRKISYSCKMLTELKECHSKIRTAKRSSRCKTNLNGWKVDNKPDEVNREGCATSENQNDVDLSNESSSDSPHPNTNCEKEAVHVGTFSCEEQHACNTNSAGENTVRVLFHDTSVGHIKDSESQYLLNESIDGVAEISKGQLVNLQPLNSSANMEHLPGNEEKISNPNHSRLISSVDQETPEPPVENAQVKLVTSNTASPKKLSPIWKNVESLEVFCRFPQTPHFKKLKSKNEEEMEGEAIGMMVNYARQAESIRSLPIDTEVTVFENKIALLNSLEENGFCVDPIRSRLQYLLETRCNYTNTVLKRVESKTGYENKEQEVTSLRLSDNSYGAKLEEIKKRIAKLEEEKKAVMMERAKVSSSLADGEQDLLHRREELNNITRSLELSLEEFIIARSKPLT